MIKFRQAWRRYRIGSMAAGDIRPWSWVYYACLRVERVASWCKTAAWRRSIGAS